jgi:hypothetical protein
MLIRLHSLPTSGHGAPEIARAVRQRLHEPSDD